MNNIVIFSILIILGLFTFYVINTTAKPKPSIQEASINSPSSTPSPSSIEPINMTTSETSSSSSQTQSTATIKTNKGDISLTLYPKDAPNTVNNFVKKTKSGFYNNLTFHRVEDWVIQGGDPLGTGTGGDNMPTELNSKPFVVGSLGVARGLDIKVSNDAQFFITKAEASWLNNQYTNFGIVTDGMDVVSKIEIGDKILKITIE